MNNDQFLVLDGNDIKFIASIRDVNGDAITSGQTVTFSLEDISVGSATVNKFYNIGNGLFDQTDEPAMINAVQETRSTGGGPVDTGEYQYDLVDKFTPGVLLYRIHIVVAGIVNQDFSVSNKLVESGALDTPNTALASVPNVETGSLRELIQLCAYVAKLKKVETDVLQTIHDESDNPFGTRDITEDPTTLTITKLS